jgi:hypothetical protein
MPDATSAHAVPSARTNRPRPFFGPRILALALALAIPLPPAAWAEPVACPGGMLAVEGASGAVADRVCTAAITARDHLAQCGLPQLQPVTLEIRDGIDGPADHCAGVYTCGSGRIVLIPPDGVASVMLPQSIFAPLPAADYYDSLVVHELVHALMDQAECPEARCDADREYVAYALQIASLSPANRALIERFREIEGPVEAERLNDFLLFMKPDVFAAHAWAHFDEPGNGCAFVADLVAGRATLALPELEN